MPNSPSSPVGLHRVLDPSGERVTLPQAAQRLDASAPLWPDEVRIEFLRLLEGEIQALLAMHVGVEMKQHRFVAHWVPLLTCDRCGQDLMETRAPWPGFDVRQMPVRPSLS